MGQSKPCARCGVAPRLPETFHMAYCRDCWNVDQRERYQAKLPPIEARPCAQCGQSYRPKRRDSTSRISIYCSKACKYRARKPLPDPRMCLHCGELFAPIRTDQYLCTRRCSNAAHRLQSKFRSRVGEPTRPGVWRAEIAERDNWTCGICSEPVDPIARYPDPLYGTLDHIVPVTKGGTNDQSNLRLAHMCCNRSRGNRVEAHASV